MTENYYDVLNCTEDASLEIIKASYQKLVKQHHPDKRNGLISEAYGKIDKAWSILRDIHTRREYDSKLMNQKLEKDNLIFSVLSPDELYLDTETSNYTYGCRCGGLYCISSDHINEDCIVHCDECSLVIVVKYNKDDT